MSDKKDDVKKLPQFKPYQIQSIIDKPETKKWNEIHKPYINGLFHSAHLAQMVNTNTVSNPRPKEQQDWLTKQGAKIKQARQDVAKAEWVDMSGVGQSFVGTTLPGQEHRKMLNSRRDIGIQSGTTNGHGDPKSNRDKEVLDRITGAVKTGKPISDEKYPDVIKLGMKKDDKK